MALQIPSDCIILTLVGPLAQPVTGLFRFVILPLPSQGSVSLHLTAPSAAKNLEPQDV